jgi:hypothetical protein
MLNLTGKARNRRREKADKCIFRTLTPPRYLGVYQATALRGEPRKVAATR